MASLKRLFPYLLFFLISLLVFLPLLTPPFKVFFPSDFLLSDLIHVNFSQKWELAQTLKHNTLPFITLKLANGFPLFAESQVGALSLYNLFAYKFLPFVLAFNLTYPLGLFLMLTFTYLIGELLWKRPILSLLFTISFSFSTVYFLQIVHLGIWQNMSLIPAIFYFVVLFQKKKQFRYLAVAALLSAQQFLNGHLFHCVATNIFVVLFLLLENWPDRQKTWKKVAISYLGYVALLLLITAPQLWQTFIFSLSSSRFEQSAKNLYESVFEARYLLTLFHPFPFGTVKDGTIFHGQLWVLPHMIPWEGNLFSGLATPLISLFVMLAFFKKKLRQVNKIPYWRSLLLLSLIYFFLMFGGKTPLRIFFSLPYMSSFRTLSRFSVFTLFFFLLSLFTLFSRLKPVTKHLILLIVLQTTAFFYFYHGYYPLVKSSEILKQGEIISKQQETQGSSLNFGTKVLWRRDFYAKGFNSVNNYLAYFQGNLPFSNLLSGTKSCGLFENSGFNPNNYFSLLHDLTDRIYNEIPSGKLSTLSKKTLMLLGCNQIISTRPIKELTFLSRDKLHYLYQNGQKPTLAELYGKTQTYFDFPDFQTSLQNGEFSLNTLNVKNGLLMNHPLPQHQIKEITVSDTHYHFITETKNTSYLFIRVLNYPGWQAKVDSKKAEILEANGVFMAIYLLPGKHQIELTYHPLFWLPSVFLMLAGYCLAGIAIFYGKLHPNKDI